MNAAQKAKLFEQQAATQATTVEKNAPTSVSTKGGKVGWSDANAQSKKRVNVGGTKTVTYSNLPAKKSLADLP